MKISLVVIGKTDANYFSEAIREYQNRLVHYIPFEMQVIPDIKNAKNLSESQQKEKEGELILKSLQAGDYWYCSMKREGIHVDAVCFLPRKENAHGFPQTGIRYRRSVWIQRSGLSGSI